MRSEKHKTTVGFSVFSTRPREPVRPPGLTHAGPVRRQLEPRRALAAVAARNVNTVGVPLAKVVPAAALVDVYGKTRTSITGPATVRWCSWTGGRAGSRNHFDLDLN